MPIPLATLQVGWAEPRSVAEDNARDYACEVMLDHAGLPGYWTSKGPNEWARVVHGWKGWAGVESDFRQPGRVVAPGLTDEDQILVLLAWTVSSGSMVLRVSDLGRLDRRRRSLAWQILERIDSDEALGAWASENDIDVPPFRGRRSAPLPFDLSRSARLVELPSAAASRQLLNEIIRAPRDATRGCDAAPIWLYYGPFPPAKNEGLEFVGVTESAPETLVEWLAAVGKAVTSRDIGRRRLEAYRMLPVGIIDEGRTLLFEGPGASRVMHDDKFEGGIGRELDWRLLAPPIHDGGEA